MDTTTYPQVRRHRLVNRVNKMIADACARHQGDPRAGFEMLEMLARFDFSRDQLPSISARVLGRRINDALDGTYTECQRIMVTPYVSIACDHELHGMLNTRPGCIELLNPEHFSLIAARDYPFAGSQKLTWSGGYAP